MDPLPANQNISQQHKAEFPTKIFKPVDKKIAKLLSMVPGTIVEIGKGKDKLAVGAEKGDNVFLFAQKSFLGRCQRVIQKEINFIRGIKETLQSMGGDTTNIAVDIEEGHKGKRYWIMQRAEGNLEKKILQNNDFQSSKTFALGLVNGMKNLHAADRVHGDVKLENLLLFPEKIVKVSDFGKGAEVSGNDPNGIYSGNTRYGPPEGKRSKPGDVYGTAIGLIRILEEQFLTDEKTSLVPVHKTTTKIPPAHSDRRGVEKYILDNTAFTRTYEQKGTGFAGKVKDFLGRVATRTGLSEDQLGFERKALNTYIKVLVGNMKENKNLNTTQAGVLQFLLESMTNTDPKARPSMEVVESSLQFIFGVPRVPAS